MVAVRFYPLDITYRTVRGKPVIHIYGRTVDGKQICVTDESFEPYFWITGKTNEIVDNISKITATQKDRTAKIVRTEVHKRKYLGKEIEAVKAFVEQPSDVPLLRDEAGKLGQFLEADIMFARRYLIDKKITPLLACEAEGDFVNERSRVDVLRAKKVSQSGETTIKDLRLLSFDIETYSPEGRIGAADEHPVIMIAFSGDGLKKVITWKRFKTKLKYVDFVNSEAELIEKFKQVIDEYKPDVLVGYFSDGFDLPYIKTRAEKYKVNLDIGLDYSKPKIGKGNVVSAGITGITHLDIFKFIRKIMGRSMDTTTYDLNSVATEILGEQKEDVDIELLPEAWDTNSDRLSEYCEYNLQDANLTYELTKRMLPNVIELVKTIGLPIFDVSRMSYSQLVEWYLMKQAQDFNELIPNRPGYDEIRKRREHTYSGGFVYEPQPGLYENVVVFDFRSLYPTIISAHNISPDTLDCNCCKAEADFTPEEDGKKSWFCKKRKGFIATVIEGLITRRMRIKEITKTAEKDKLLAARESVLKTIANSMYGYMGFFGARWYSIECARSITAYGRYYIQGVIDKAKDTGYKVLYSDTDSIFMTLDGKTENEVGKFVEGLNLSLPGLMELEYEGLYPSGIFVSAKGTGIGAKKKYALLNEKGKLKIRGFETVRRNLSPIAKEVQENVLNIILKKKDAKKAVEYVKETVGNLRDKKIEAEKVIISTQLQKELKSYDAIGPHVAVAQRMESMGKPIGPGSLIKYIVTQGKDRIRDRARLPEEVKAGEYDSDYYLNNQVLPAVDKIFEVLGIDIKTEIETKSQSKLDSYFGK
ncbi:MAG: DNA polymerase [bacterium]|nr:DNA polymerase [bacterium]